MKHNFLDGVLVTIGCIFYACAFLLVVLFDLPASFFILSVVLNLSMCLGVEWIANAKAEYSIPFVLSAISTFLMVLFAFKEVHVAYTFIPAAIVSGFTGASVTKEDSSPLMGMLVSIVAFLMVWFVNISLMCVC